MGAGRRQGIIEANYTLDSSYGIQTPFANMLSKYAKLRIIMRFFLTHNTCVSTYIVNSDIDNIQPIIILILKSTLLSIFFKLQLSLPNVMHLSFILDIKYFQ